MLGSNMTKSEYKREIRRLEKNLTARAKSIAGHESASQYLPNKMREVRQRYPFKLDNMDINELRSYYRTLRGINETKSSTLKGAYKARKAFGNTEKIISKFDDDRKTKFFSLYDRIYENFITYGQDFKYELFETIADVMNTASDDNVSEAFVDDLMLDLDRLYEDAEINDYDDEELKDEFIQLVSRLRDYYTGTPY